MIKIDNEKLKNSLKDRDKIINSLYEEDIDDEQLEKLNLLNNLPPLERDIFFLHTVYGTNYTAEVYGCSTRLIQYKIKEIKQKLNLI